MTVELAALLCAVVIVVATDRVVTHWRKKARLADPRSTSPEGADGASDRPIQERRSRRYRC